MNPLKYLKQELGFKLAEYSQLTATDKEDLRRWAIEEMEHLGIEYTTK